MSRRSHTSSDPLQAVANRHGLADGDQPRKLILMRGLPSCGKTTRAKELAGDAGVALEFDEYFYTQVGTDPSRYDWSRKRLSDAREWNVERATLALALGLSPVVLDDDNGLGQTTRRVVRAALEHGYVIEFQEPRTPWWREIRELLRDKRANKQALEIWASKLTGLSRATHRVPFESFLRRIERWQDELTVDAVIAAALPSQAKPLTAG